MSHRFVTVRRGSPAARSGQIQPGDQLEAVEGRPVAGLQHRDLAQILRRAGNTLRLSITPRHRMKKHRYTKNTYTYSKLVEINGDSTAGMTHSQAVEQIRRGGHRIHLVLKKGNGYVPDYGETSHDTAERKLGDILSAKTSVSTFSFLMPLDDDRHLSDSESTSSFSEMHLSAASIATAGSREESDWRRAELPLQDGNGPGPWLKPSTQRLTRVLTSSQIRGRGLAGGLSL
uniref:PDZ domain-containing protein n=1 Tax=Pundamilia nyererei TaxID=303518 RepID=A0A3B4H2W8_9CICH